MTLFFAFAAYVYRIVSNHYDIRFRIKTKKTRRLHKRRQAVGCRGTTLVGPSCTKDPPRLRCAHIADPITEVTRRSVLAVNDSAAQYAAKPPSTFPLRRSRASFRLSSSASHHPAALCSKPIPYCSRSQRLSIDEIEVDCDYSMRSGCCQCILNKVDKFKSTP